MEFSLILVPYISLFFEVLVFGMVFLIILDKTKIFNIFFSKPFPANFFFLGLLSILLGYIVSILSYSIFGSEWIGSTPTNSWALPFPLLYGMKKSAQCYLSYGKEGCGFLSISYLGAILNILYWPIAYAILKHYSIKRNYQLFILLTIVIMSVLTIIGNWGKTMPL